jgi:endonuclease/exonuclease/phosphatase family metal-dependent hydrolase
MNFKKLSVMVLGILVSVSVALPALAETFSVMTYNMENMFDNVHNEGVEDYSYLPLSVKQTSKEVQAYCLAMSSQFYREKCLKEDWNDKVVGQKLKNVAEVVRGAVPGGADVLIVQEVENKNILTQLVEQELYDLGYKQIHVTSGPDPRGINVAVISRFPLVEAPKFHAIDLSDAYPGKEPKLTRGIIEVTLKVGGKAVTFMSNHWPSQNNPHITRVMAAKVMIKAVKESKYPVISAGDFNTTDKDSPHAINEQLLNPKAEFGFEAIEDTASLLNEGGKPGLRQGTHFYKGEWSLLDRFFVAKNHLCSSTKDKNCLVADLTSYKIYKHASMVRDENYRGRTFSGIPFHYEPASGEGASDHLPVVVRFEVR